MRSTRLVIQILQIKLKEYLILNSPNLNSLSRVRIQTDTWNMGTLKWQYCLTFKFYFNHKKCDFAKNLDTCTQYPCLPIEKSQGIFSWILPKSMGGCVFSVDDNTKCVILWECILSCWRTGLTISSILKQFIKMKNILIPWSCHI